MISFLSHKFLSKVLMNSLSLSSCKYLSFLYIVWFEIARVCKYHKICLNFGEVVFIFYK